MKSQHFTEARTTAITERVVNMIALDLKPICMVKGEGFVSLHHYLKPGYKISSRKHVTMMIQRQHKSVKEKPLKIEKDSTSASLITDIWSHDVTEAYGTLQKRLCCVV